MKKQIMLLFAPKPASLNSLIWCVLSFCTISLFSVIISFGGDLKESVKMIPIPGMTIEKVQQKENQWDIKFNGFFSNGEFPLVIAGRENNNCWLAAVGSSIIPETGKYSFNNSYYWIDMSNVPIRNGVIKGPVSVHLTPDIYIPGNHMGCTVELELNAIVKSDGTMGGNYTILKIDPDDLPVQKFGKGGTITGSSKPVTLEILKDSVAFTLNFQNALFGAKPEYLERCLVLKLIFLNKSLTSGFSGKMSLLNEVYDLSGLQVSESSVRYIKDSIVGKITVPSSTLDLIPCSYTIEFEGCIVDNKVAGFYNMIMNIKDGETINRDGFFDGNLESGKKGFPITDIRPWWVPEKHFQPPQKGEHPRLLFRRSDIPSLRKKAETPEGKAIIANLRRQLNGGDGESMPTRYSNALKAYDNKSVLDLPIGTYTMSHVAGYGLLFQLTGEKRYAELGRQCFELAINGQRDRDDRYSWKAPGGALRAGVVLGWYAIGYDLCYDGWDEATRIKFGKAIENYDMGREQKNAGAVIDLESLVRGTMPPGSNHFGMQVGGAALALMAINGEQWADQKRISTFLKISEKSMIRNVTEGFGDGGFFAEGDGTGSMSSHIVYLTAVQAWRNAMGMDFVNVERPNVRMTALKWIYLTVVRNGKPDFWPIRGAYGQNVWDRGLSGGGYFGIGFGAVSEKQQAAMKWYYSHFLLEPDTKAGIPYEQGNYPHLSTCAFVNWPVEVPEKNPAEVIPLCYRDSIRSFYAWRNRWKDENDIVISVLTKPTKGYMGSKADSSLQVAAFGKKFSWGEIDGNVRYWHYSQMGETSVLTDENGSSFAVDFTQASGAEGMLVTTGKADGLNVKLRNATLTFKFLTDGQEPILKVESDKVIAGKQIVMVKNGNIVFAVTSRF